MDPVPVVTVASVDPVLRDSTAANLLCDVPGAVVLHHDLTEDGVLRRSVYDASGALERVDRELDHGCMSCALREDVIPSLARLVESVPRPGAVVLALPVSAEPLPVIRALAPGRWGRRPVAGAVPAGVVAALDGATCVHDLIGDDLLTERGLAMAQDDRRAVGEALAAQVEYADVLAVPGPTPPVAAALLAHLTGPQVPVQAATSMDVGALLAARRSDDDPRGDVRRVAGTGAPDRDAVWTLELASWRPLHPGRLLSSIEVLGSGPLRGRGYFWLPSRPWAVGAWNGAGGQLAIGTLESWAEPAERGTHLVVTGVDHDPEPLRHAFADALVTDAELARGLGWWTTRPDGFDQWLGDDRLSA